jgi:very-short-patch-repair endonuclease
MGGLDDRSMLALAHRQQEVISGAQLRAAGYSARAIKHRVERGRLHRLWRDVFAVGRPDVTERGRWMAATLACGADAALSHESAAALMGIHPDPQLVHVSVPGARARHAGIRCHRRTPMPPTTTIDGIATVELGHTLIDLAAHLPIEPLTRAVNEADKLNLIDHNDLTALVESFPGRRGIRKLRMILNTYSRTDSNLERRFLRLVDRAGLPKPQTQVRISGMRIDFAWPDVALAVETDGLTYHRTPAAQAADRKRDQALAAAGITCLRFTNAQIRNEPRVVMATLRRVYERSARNASSSRISVPSFSAFASFDPGSAPRSR